MVCGWFWEERVVLKWRAATWRKVPVMNPPCGTEPMHHSSGKSASYVCDEVCFKAVASAKLLGGAMANVG